MQAHTSVPSSWIPRICQTCGTQFYAKPRRKMAKFCCSVCYGVSLSTPNLDRFLAKIDKMTDQEWNGTKCWIWRAGTGYFDYGHFSYNHKAIPAHRASWLMFNGDIPGGLFVLHHCDIPACVNPGHLFLGTQADNMADMVAKQRSATGLRNGKSLYPEKIPRGEKHPMCRLTEAQVLEIRSRMANGENRFSLAVEFGMAPVTIWAIHRRRIWRHLPPG